MISVISYLYSIRFIAFCCWNSEKKSWVPHSTIGIHASVLLFLCVCYSWFRPKGWIAILVCVWLTCLYWTNKIGLYKRLRVILLVCFRLGEIFWSITSTSIISTARPSYTGNRLHHPWLRSFRGRPEMKLDRKWTECTRIYKNIQKCTYIVHFVAFRRLENFERSVLLRQNTIQLFVEDHLGQFYLQKHFHKLKKIFLRNWKSN